MSRLILLLLPFSILSVVSAQDCVWDKDSDFPTSYPPLVINLESWSAYHAVIEDGSRIVRIEEGATVVVACPGSTLDIGGEVAEGVCSEGNLVIDNNDYSINDLACDSRVDDNAYYTGSSCGHENIGQEASIGFEVTGYPFYEVINVCFEHDLKIPIYAQSVVYGASVEATDSNPNRPSFQMGNEFYESDLDDCYSTKNQDTYYNDLLGETEFIDTGINHFFSRGHMSPNADFFNEMEADSTFFYINAVPQWQDYNGINWAQFEGCVRSMASNYSTDIQVWTGPWKQLTVDDSSGTPTELYHCASQGSETIPVPELVWKVVYEPSTDSGLAVIISNVPYETSPPTPICEDVGCTDVEWMEGITSPLQLDRGYLYCCSVQDFRTAVPHAPDLGSAGLLLNWK